MKFILKFLKKILIALVAILLIATVLLYATGNEYIFRGVQLTYLKGNTTANIDDRLDFDTRIIENGTVQEWELSEDYNKTPLTDTLVKELEAYKSAGFLIVKDGKILNEEYFNGYNSTSLTNSFSVSKSILTLLLGKSLEDGFIESLDDPITKYLPEFKDDTLAQYCTVGDLSAMTAGYDWSESYYLPLNPTAKAYYGRDIVDQMLSRGFIKESGKEFKYLSGVTQLLGIVISRAIKKDLSGYLSEKFWKPMGMSKESYWALDDEEGMEKAYCCMYSNVRDFAKFGQLILDNGKWNGTQLIDSSFVALMKTPNHKAFIQKTQPIYGYSLWLDYDYKTPFYSLIGHLGQYVAIIPSENMIIVRLGENRDRRNTKMGVLPGNDLYYYVDEAIEMQSK
ncbi:beta-lactamase family protein [Flavobacteriales bacterium]|nr:beta-lactamase family protein [Flavobacteriales bacterium]